MPSVVSKLKRSMSQNSLSFRLLSYILLCSSVLAVVITIVQLLWDYRKDVGQIENSITQIEASFLQPIAASLWNLDEEQVQVQVEGIMNLPNMQYVLIKEILGSSEVPLIEKGMLKQKFDISREFDLVYQGEVVGRLLVAASLDEVYRRLIEKSMVILVSQTIKTLVVSICILLIIYYLVIRHLNRIADYTRSLKLDSVSPPLKLEGRDPHPANPDELDGLAATYNQMREKIFAELSAKEKANQELAGERDFSTTIINSSTSVICCLDQSLDIDTINPAGVILTGYSQHEMSGRSWLELFVNPEQREEVSKQLKKYQDQKDFEITMTDQLGETNTLIWSFVPFYEGDHFKYLIAFGYDVSSLKRVEKEIKRLNDQLEEKVIKRTASLEQSNNQLVIAFDELKRAQQTLVESEKMASLGSLVAGVAHEINTPIGISVTASSYLQDQTKSLQQRVAEGKLSRAYIEELTGNMNESCNLLMSNLRRASDLISSFKQVAVDQSSEACYTFNLEENLNQVVTSLNHKLKKARCVVETHCDGDLKMHSFPGSFTQIYSNLIINSVNHGFDEWDGERKIVIDVTRQDDRLLIDYRDTGRGIDKEIAPRIFDPFVTSKRGHGGSGLGTHVIYNLVVQLLKGSIEHDTSVEQGVCFRINIPYHNV
ncbi:MULTISPECIES: ATP-binding protein [unclassified Motilimonas]|uniref:sensor histidine kinase n=1 Tax=Motilimonas TaxID=1914248 RepID=UPI001E3CDCBB|nr:MULTISPECIES: ATP-binding protein [unclassified Motilimonas]MCE0558340.1 PAS domain S-box protein [Motilimonas sp. E26]MDO6525308.1 ATP-binding protein [Motilimonas sp. 1_MG-2023]